MAIKKYREQCEADVAKVASQEVRQTTEYVAERLKAEKGGAAEKAAAIESVQLTADNLGGQIDQLIKILLKKSESVKARNAAMNQLNKAEFFGAAYQPHKAKVEEAIRSVATDKSTTIRHSALQNLALSKDDYARDILTKSLKSDNEDVIDNAGAIRLLGLDDHGEASKLAKFMFEGLDKKAKKEAVRVMASDPSASKLLSKVMKDKSHENDLRQLSAIGLQKIDASEFMENALKAMEDPDEDPRVKAAYISTAKVEFTDMGQAVEKAAKDSAKLLAKQIKDLRKTTNSRILKGAVKKYLKKADKI
jgi:HEAT repeat protein